MNRSAPRYTYRILDSEYENANVLYEHDHSYPRPHFARTLGVRRAKVGEFVEVVEMSPLVLIKVVK